MEETPLLFGVAWLGILYHFQFCKRLVLLASLHALVILLLYLFFIILGVYFLRFTIMYNRHILMTLHFQGREEWRRGDGWNRGHGCGAVGLFTEASKIGSDLLA